MSEQTIFTAALEQEPDRRQAFLDKACAGNAELRQWIEVLLKAHG